jgi:hypothetical protein
MASLIDNPATEWISNEVYQIEVTDPCQGHGVGSSFGGLGIHNQPHQQLANRTAFLKQRQDTNIANIAALTAFIDGFIFDEAANGYWKLPATAFSVGGTIFPTLQWGFYSWFGLTAAQVTNESFVITLPTSFPNKLYFAAGFIATNLTGAQGALANSSMSLEVATPLPSSGPLTQITFYADYGQAGTVKIASATQSGLTGFSWLALGF